MLEAKNKCYPKNIEVNEVYCKIPFQDLLNHTTTRIFETKMLEKVNPIMQNYEILCKWGCDGSNQ